MNTTTKNCSGQFYCGHWRSCERCAAVRAARIADRVEWLEKKRGQLSLTVAKPMENTARAIKELRDKLVRAKLAPSGIWTIETGELFSGLHLNLITPVSAAHRLAALGHHTETIRTSARAAAAYICKRSGMPTPQQYEGRLFGEWGKISKIIGTTRWQGASAAQAALFEWSLSTEEQRAAKSQIYRENMDFALAHNPVRIEKTREEYREIARRNLPNMLAAVGRTSL